MTPYHAIPAQYDSIPATEHTQVTRDLCRGQHPLHADSELVVAKPALGRAPKSVYIVFGKWAYYGHRWYATQVLGPWHKFSRIGSVYNVHCTMYMFVNVAIPNAGSGGNYIGSKDIQDWPIPYWVIISSLHIEHMHARRIMTNKGYLLSNHCGNFLELSSKQWMVMNSRNNETTKN